MIDKKNLNIYLIFGISTLALLFGGVWSMSKSFSGEDQVENIVDNQLLVKDDSYKKGPDSAKVTIVEFSDFQCPACKVNAQALNQVINEYPDQIRVIFRHFPLSFHKNAPLAAQAVEAAGKQDKFWEMHDLIFDRQTEWSEVKNAAETFHIFAQELELDEEQFKIDLNDQSIKEKISRDTSDGYQAKVNATPTFFINGQKAMGVGSKEFNSLLEQELNK